MPKTRVCARVARLLGFPPIPIYTPYKGYSGEWGIGAMRWGMSNF